MLLRCSFPGRKCKELQDTASDKKGARRRGLGDAALAAYTTVFGNPNQGFNLWHPFNERRRSMESVLKSLGEYVGSFIANSGMGRAHTEATTRTDGNGTINLSQAHPDNQTHIDELLRELDNTEVDSSWAHDTVERMFSETIPSESAKQELILNLRACISQEVSRENQHRVQFLEEVGAISDGISGAVRDVEKVRRKLDRLEANLEDASSLVLTEMQRRVALVQIADTYNREHSSLMRDYKERIQEGTQFSKDMDTFFQKYNKI